MRTSYAGQRSYIGINSDFMQNASTKLAVATSLSILALGVTNRSIDCTSHLSDVMSSLYFEEESATADIFELPENIFTSGYVTYLNKNTTQYILPDPVVEEVETTVQSLVEEPIYRYVDTGSQSCLNVRRSASAESDILTQLKPGTQVTLLEEVDSKTSFVKVTFDGGEGYISSKFISETEPEIPSGSYNSTTINDNTQYDGEVLNSYIGTVNGPSGKETYYNLPMSKVVENMHNLGYEGEYWVRGDGVKCLGDYIMVAADLNVHPRGSIVETSLGLARVCDTGDFAKSNHHQLDVAVTW